MQRVAATGTTKTILSKLWLSNISVCASNAASLSLLIYTIKNQSRQHFTVLPNCHAEQHQLPRKENSQNFFRVKLSESIKRGKCISPKVIMWEKRELFQVVVVAVKKKCRKPNGDALSFGSKQRLLASNKYCHSSHLAPLSIFQW